jgi:hypothetical protein
MSKGISGKLFKFIRENIGRWNVSAMVRNLGVSLSGFYRFIKRLKKSDGALLTDIKNLIDEHIYNDNYGRDRAQKGLLAKGKKVGLGKIKDVMKEAGLPAKKIIRKRCPRR